MTLLFMLSLVGIGAYFLWRRGRGIDQPTVWQDIKGVFSFKRSGDPRPNLEEGFEPRQKRGPVPSKSQDGRDREFDHNLSDIDRLDEIVNLNDLWNQSSHPEAKRREEL